MHIHLLGIGGTFMSGLALLAKEMGHRVTGHDKACYPPVSDLLIKHGIDWIEDETEETLMHQADEVIVGNTMRRGMPLVESLLRQRKQYYSGPQWLAERVLSTRRVVAIAGTHGKTTTTSMIAYLLSRLGHEPGFLIGGVSPYFNTNASLGTGDWFVIEADEYDSAFFDKRPKFLHYKPDILLLNNLEFDHADIYPDLEAIKKQFSYLIRTVPPQGTIIYPPKEPALSAVIAEGVWSQVKTMGEGGDYVAQPLDSAASTFKMTSPGSEEVVVTWPLIGSFNMQNALGAMVSLFAMNIPFAASSSHLAQFVPVKRRLEIKGVVHGVTVYDDFAHHPTAIEKTLEALSHSRRHRRIIAILEFASYTMRSGVHESKIPACLRLADKVYILKPISFELPSEGWSRPPVYAETTDDLMEHIIQDIQPEDGLLIMSNRGFDGLHDKLLKKITSCKRTD